MASATHRLAPNFRDVIIKAASLRLSDAAVSTTTDYAEIICGDGVPSGAYGRHSGATLIYLRKDASSVAVAMYVSVNGGTAWTAMDPAAVSGADLTINDTFALKFGTPGTDLVLTADGADVVVTSTGDLVFNDSVDLKIGTGKDIGIAWDGTDLLVSQAAADSIIKWGVSGAGINHVFYGDTATYDLTWDQSNDQLLFADNTKLAIGSGAGAAGDITFSWDATRLNVNQLTANSAIWWGVDGAGIDHIFYGDTASATMVWDQSADKLIFTGVAKIQLQTIVAATGTAIPVTHSGSFPITQNGAETNTLADPTFLGQTLSIFVDTDTSGARVVTAASRINQTGTDRIMTFTEAGDFIKLEAITVGGALKWQIVANDGVVLT
jgi:hypothetical protein